MKLLNAIASIGFIILAALCGYGIYALINMIIQGISSANWMMAIGGGILAYLFIGIFIFGAIASIIAAIIVIVLD